MPKWIQPVGHSDYTNLTTQICRSNHSSPDFGQNQTEKVVQKQPKGRAFILLQTLIVPYGPLI
jgi:hypothetical protein